MDTVFEEPASPTNSSAPLSTAEAAEGEGVVRSRTQPNNNWGPILYNHKCHPLQIMVSGPALIRFGEGSTGDIPRYQMHCYVTYQN